MSPGVYYGSELFSVLDATIESNAVMIASIMPSSLSFSQVDDGIAADIAAALKKITARGVHVWLRFAHEMNWFVKTGQYRGDPSEFITAWRTVCNAVREVPGVRMFWSPNWAPIDNIEPWWPGADFVDLVGMDVYANHDSSFSNVFDGFYGRFVEPYNKPMALGETSVKNGTAADRERWLKILANSNLSAYPCFRSVTWFEYLDGVVDYRVVLGQTRATVNKTLSNFT